MQREYSAGQQPATARTSVVRCDCRYLGTLSGISKIVQTVSSLICFICTQQIFSISQCSGCSGWFQTATITGVIVSLALLVLYLFHFVEKWAHLPWLIVDLLICLLWTIFNLSVFWRNISIQGLNTASSALFTSISIFSFISMVAFGFDAVLKVIRMIRRQPAQE